MSSALRLPEGVTRSQILSTLQMQISKALPKPECDPATHRCSPQCHGHMRSLDMVLYGIKGDTTSYHVCSRFCKNDFALCKRPSPQRIRYGQFSLFYCDRSGCIHACGSFCSREFEIDESGMTYCGLTGIALERQVADDVKRVLSHRARYDRPQRTKITHEIGADRGHWAQDVAVQHWQWSGSSIVCGSLPTVCSSHVESANAVQTEEASLKHLYKNAGKDLLLMCRIVTSVMLSSPQYAIVSHRKAKTIMNKTVKNVTDSIHKMRRDAADIVDLRSIMHSACAAQFPQLCITMGPRSFMRVVECIATKITRFWLEHFSETPISPEAVVAVLYLSSEGWNSRNLFVRSNEFLASVLVPRRSLALFGINPQSKCCAYDAAPA